MITRRMKLLCSALMLLASHGALTVSYPLPPEGSCLVNSAFTIAVLENNIQPLESLATRYGQGLNNILKTSPGVDVYLPHSGSTLTVPQQLILPGTVREGIIINVTEMHLYYHLPLGNSVEVLPIGVGQVGRETPHSWVTTVGHKQEGPTWVPTANIQREYAEEGKTLSALVPPGPNNPMGLYAIYIGRLYTIYDTDADFDIGLRASQGRIRLYNDDIRLLFDNVPAETHVQLTDQPVKYAVKPGDSHWLEVYESLLRNWAEFESSKKVPLSMASTLCEFIQRPEVSPSQAERTPQRRFDIPMSISAATVQESLQRGVWLS